MSSKLWCLVWLYLVLELKADQKCQGKAASMPNFLYTLLKCEPNYGADKCITSYTCPNDNRSKDTCHFKGKFYQIGEHIDDGLLTEISRQNCACAAGSEFRCPYLADGCAEYWVSGYISPGCYLRKKLGQDCSDGQICPPFDGNAECKANGKTYKEGEQFESPNDHCAQCVCDKGFDGKFEAPFCQPINCTWTLFDGGKNLDNFCAPYYKDFEKGCCPELWVCADPKDEYHTSSVPSANPDLTCKYGDKSMGIGDYLIQNVNTPEAVKCECVVPPYLHCIPATATATATG